MDSITGSPSSSPSPSPQHPSSVVHHSPPSDRNSQGTPLVQGHTANPAERHCPLSHPRLLARTLENPHSSKCTKPWHWLEDEKVLGRERATKHVRRFWSGVTRPRGVKHIESHLSCQHPHCALLCARGLQSSEHVGSTNSSSLRRGQAGSPTTGTRFSPHAHSIRPPGHLSG